MRDLGVPCLVNPADPSEIWIDWDAAYDEHAPAWEREARVRREVERRKGGLDGALAAAQQPARGQAPAEDEELRRTRERKSADARRCGGPRPAERAGPELRARRRMDELAPHRATHGRKTTGTVVARDGDDRTLRPTSR